MVEEQKELLRTNTKSSDNTNAFCRQGKTNGMVFMGPPPYILLETTMRITFYSYEMDQWIRDHSVEYIINLAT